MSNASISLAGQTLLKLVQEYECLPDCLCLHTPAVRSRDFKVKGSLVKTKQIGIVIYIEFFFSSIFFSEKQNTS